ncbi:MAG: hypothetical protein AMXMBFR4_27190 [Candidatus Hydrogenedentota bacterium]
MSTSLQDIRRLSELDRLPWFEKDEDGRIRLRPDAGVPRVFDIHSHVASSAGLARDIDYGSRPPLVYFYDYERDQDVLNVDTHPYPDEAVKIGNEIRWLLLKQGPMGATHTAANFADEMDRFHYAHACLLPIEGPIASRHAEATLRAAKLDPRFIPFAAVHPYRWGPRQEARLEELVRRGTPALKYHPEFQFITPDNPHSMKLFEWCAAHDLPVLAHCGYTGAEPEWLRRKAEPERFRKALEAFPNLRLLLAHTGLSRWRETLDFVKLFDDRIWLDISGQPVPSMKTILREYARERICYGSDWPFYPLAIALARTLAATEDCPHYRRDLLFNNAARFLKMAA